MSDNERDDESTGYLTQPEENLDVVRRLKKLNFDVFAFTINEKKEDTLIKKEKKLKQSKISNDGSLYFTTRKEDWDAKCEQEKQERKNCKNKKLENKQSSTIQKKAKAQMKRTMENYLREPIPKRAKKQQEEPNDDDDSAGDIPHVIPWIDKPDDEDIFW